MISDRNIFFYYWYEKMILGKDGKISKSEFWINALKCPLLHIREQKPKDREKYIRNTSDEQFDNMSFQDVEQKLKHLNEFKEGESQSTMVDRLKKMEQSRHMKIWHDLSTVANHSHLVFLVSFLYDAATFTDVPMKNIIKLLGKILKFKEQLRSLNYI